MMSLENLFWEWKVRRIRERWSRVSPELDALAIEEGCRAALHDLEDSFSDLVRARVREFLTGQLAGSLEPDPAEQADTYATLLDVRDEAEADLSDVEKRYGADFRWYLPFRRAAVEIKRAHRHLSRTLEARRKMRREMLARRQKRARFDRLCEQLVAPSIALYKANRNHRPALLSMTAPATPPATAPGTSSVNQLAQMNVQMGGSPCPA